MHKANKEIKTTDLVNVINPIISINTTEAKTDKSFLEFDKAKGDIAQDRQLKSLFYR